MVADAFLFVFNRALLTYFPSLSLNISLVILYIRYDERSNAETRVTTLATTTTITTLTTRQFVLIGPFKVSIPMASMASMTSLPLGDSRLLETVEETLEQSFKEVQLVAVGPELRANQEFKDAIKILGLSVCYVDAVPDNPSSSSSSKGSNDVRMAYVLSDFQGPVYSTLRSSSAQILGPTLIIQLASMNLEFPNNNRPQYSNSMASVTLCFTGFKVKEELMNLVNLVHHMGGTVRKDMSNSSKVTHLVANHTSGKAIILL